MATYPIKMLRDEDKQAFVPFTNAAAVVDKDNKSLQELMDSGKYKIQNNVTTSSAGKGVLDAYQGKVLNDKFNNYVPLSQKGVANGVASLDAEGKVPSAQLPSYVDDVIESYIVSGSTALSSGWLSKTDGGTALTPEKGKIYLIMTSGSYQNKQYRWGGSTYVLCNPSDVNSVNGMTGVVTLKKLTIQKNGTQVGDTFNGSADKVINITVPTNNNQLTNGAGYITSAGSITGNAATATKATQDGAGNVITDTYVKKAGDTMTGDLSTSTLTISSVDKEAHLHFARNNYNYITTTSGGSFAFISNGKAAGVSANSDLIVGNNSVTPGTTNVASLGTSSLKWKAVYATTLNGNLTGNVTGNVTGNLTGNVNGHAINGAVYAPVVITKSLTVGTDWMDTGIVCADIGDTGSYMVQVTGANQGQGGLWGELFTGVMTVFATTTNSGASDEILLQNSGHAPNGGDLFLRIIRTGRDTDGSCKLQIASKIAFTAAQNMKFTFRRII